MLQIIQTQPCVIANVWYEDSWVLTGDAVFNNWPTDGVGFIDCYGRMYTINNVADLEVACQIIASSSDFGG
jgi:hypothetical protein